MEYGGLKPILPFLGVRSDAACRVVVIRMREEHFKHALPVLWAVRFLCGWPARRFFCPWRAPAGCGAFGRGPVRATPATPVCGPEGQGGRSASQAKALRRRQGRAFFPPFLWRSKERGRGGGGGAQPPRRGVGFPAFRVANCGKTHMYRASTRSARHRPYQDAIASLVNW